MKYIFLYRSDIQYEESVTSPVTIHSKSIRPKCWAKEDHKHGDWFLRKFCLKNKIIIYNNSEYEIEAHITPRNTMGSKVYTIAPNSRFSLKNYPSLSYYMQTFVESNEISNKLYYCNSDIVISSKKDVQHATNYPSND